MLNEKVKLTKQGYQARKDELYRLVHVDSEEIKKKIEEARSQGDLSENADYDAARKDQGLIQDRIAELENLLNNCEIIEKVSTDKVGIGTTVTVLFFKNKKSRNFSIVSTFEADPFENKISTNCPLGEAIDGKKIGDVCLVKVKEPYECKIIDIFAD